jgi:putative transcriptional regulator
MHSPRSTPPPTNLAGSILLAHPGLLDPNFRRTVVLMSVHNKDGAMGVVLNRPLGKTLSELNGSFAYGPLSSVPVFSGGPVQPEQLILVAWQPCDEGYRLHFGVEPEKASELLNDGVTQLRAFVGYSGWESGQLENEMKMNTWVVAPMAPEMIGVSPDESLWRSMFSSMGPEWRLLASAPDKPENN